MARAAGFVSTVFEMLKEDHDKVKKLFEDFESAEGRERGEIAKTAIQELEIHADLEERLIYPAIRAELDDADMMNEAVEEHHLVHVLIAELKKLKSGDEKFQAKFSVLSELVKHHIQEEEDEMFPKAEACDIDWESLEATVLKRKETLMAKASGRKTGARHPGKPLDRRPCRRGPTRGGLCHAQRSFQAGE
ncbi:MAG: hemerythrin domain-containing protein [Nitrospira sp.]|nr:hemerythrin domain-containing protein [Nitrospira sp.]